MRTGVPAPTADRSARGSWAGRRWWLPGTVVALGAVVAGGLVTEGWYAYEAGGCGQGGAMFACLVESLVGVAAAVVLGPLVLWGAYRRAGVPHALPGVVVAAVVALCLPALAELVAQVGVLQGRERTDDSPSGLVVGAFLGLAVLGGGLALTGPYRLVRAVVAAGALGALVVTVLALHDPVERASSRLELERVQVPLLVPAGWQVSRPYVGEGGDLTYDAVPAGWQGDGFGGVGMTVTTPHRALDTCALDPCADEGDVRVEVPGPGSDTRRAWRAVDGVVVEAVTFDDDPRVDLADLLRALEALTVDQVVDRLYLG